MTWPWSLSIQVGTSIATRTEGRIGGSERSIRITGTLYLFPDNGSYVIIIKAINKFSEIVFIVRRRFRWNRRVRRNQE